jgi:dienelactone hydrolase
MGVVGYPVWSASSPAVCGQTPYTWLPATSVGTVLESSTKLTLLSLFVKTLNGVAFLGSQLNVHHSLNNDVGRAVIRYQTQDRGKLVDATAMVTWPTSGAKNVPLLLFLHPTLGYTDGCAPSARAGDVTAPMTILSLLFASAGYVTVFPDYLNQRSLGAPSTDVTPYLLMEPTAIASLDAARAAQKFLVSKGSTTASSDLYVWGHSQGAQAVEFVTALQPLYAPEYSVKGVAAVSPPSDVAASAKLNFAGPAPTFGLGEAVAYTWSSYYDPTALSTGLIDPWIGRAPGELQNYCTSGYVDPLTKVTDPTTVFAQPFTSVFTQGGKSEPWSCWLHYNNPPTMGPPMNVSVPMLYVTGEQDTTVFPTANDPVAAKWCSQGMQIQYLKCSATDHMHSITNSIDDVLSFFDNRVAGKPLPTALCQNTPAVKCASTP